MQRIFYSKPKEASLSETKVKNHGYMRTSKPGKSKQTPPWFARSQLVQFTNWTRTYHPNMLFHVHLRSTLASIFLPERVHFDLHLGDLLQAILNLIAVEKEDNIPRVRTLYYKLINHKQPSAYRTYTGNSTLHGHISHAYRFHMHTDFTRIQISYAYRFHTHTDFIRIHISYAYTFHTHTDFIRIQISHAYTFHTHTDFTRIHISYAYRFHTHTHFIRIHISYAYTFHTHTDFMG